MIKLKSKTVSVFGDACTDVFIYGKTPRICPEAPVPVFLPEKTEINTGMALNVSRNIESLGISCCSITNNPERINKKRYVDWNTNHMLLRVDTELPLDACSVDNIPKEAWKSDACVVSDYDKGFLSEKICTVLSNKFPLSFIDTKKKLGKWCDNFTFIKINEEEYSKSDYSKSPKIQEKLIVTLGKGGCMYMGKVYPTPKITTTVNVCGAGDTFLSGFIVSYMKSANTDKAINYALLCASDVVQRRGVSVPFKDNE